jgi:hypothetical protein
LRETDEAIRTECPDQVARVEAALVDEDDLAIFEVAGECGSRKEAHVLRPGLL